MDFNFKNPRSWPELEGRNVDEAVEEIRQANSNLNVVKLPKGSMVTKDLRMDRVRVFYNTETNLVEGTPYTG